MSHRGTFWMQGFVPSAWWWKRWQKIKELVLLTGFNHDAQGLPLPTVFSHGCMPAVQCQDPRLMPPNGSNPGAGWHMSTRGTQPRPWWHGDSSGNGAGVEHGAGSVPMAVPWHGLRLRCSANCPGKGRCHSLLLAAALTLPWRCSLIHPTAQCGGAASSAIWRWISHCGEVGSLADWLQELG